MDLFDRILELSRYGYFCSQILAILMLETVGEENPGLVNRKRTPENEKKDAPKSRRSTWG